MKVIAGVYTNKGQAYFWEVSPDLAYDLYDYAIVQDKDDLALVKIVGSGIITDDFVLPFGQVNKKVIKIIKADDIIPIEKTDRW